MIPILRVTIGLKDRIWVKHISGTNIYRCLINVSCYYYYTTITVLLMRLLDGSAQGRMTNKKAKGTEAAGYDGLF